MFVPLQSRFKQERVFNAQAERLELLKRSLKRLKGKVQASKFKRASVSLEKLGCQGQA
jgi:hypothetical protein